MYVITVNSGCFGLTCNVQIYVVTYIQLQLDHSSAMVAMHTYTQEPQGQLVKNTEE